MKHTEMSAGDLSKAMAAATTIEEHEKKVIERRRQEKGETLEDLPPGHPVLLAIEQAKQRHEERQQFEAEKAEAVERMKAKRAKRAQKKATNNAAREAVEKKSLDTAAELNANIDKLAAQVAALGGIVDNSERDLVGGARVKVQRLKRLLLATHKGLASSKLNTRRVEWDEDRA